MFNPSRGHELSGVNTRGIWIFILCFITSAVVMFIAIGLTFTTIVRRVQRHEPPEPVVRTDIPSHLDQPLQPSPGHPTLAWQDLAAMKVAQIKSLHTYATIPSDPSHARIPIHRAMQLLIESNALTIPPNPNAMPSTQPYINTTQPRATENRT